MKNSTPTLRDIALAADVSPMTVSLALRNQTTVSAATRERIQALAAQMGYRRDPVVARLMAQLPRSRRMHSPLLAFVTDHPKPMESLRSEVDVSSYRGAAQRAQELGYRLEEFQVTGKMSAARLSRILRNRGIEGVIIGPLRHAETRLPLDWRHFACVAIGHSLVEPRINRVCNNQFQGISLALVEMHRLGYRRIGLVISADNDLRVNHIYLGGYAVAGTVLKLFDPVPPLVYDQIIEEQIGAWLNNLLGLLGAVDHRHHDGVAGRIQYLADDPRLRPGNPDQ